MVGFADRCPGSGVGGQYDLRIARFESIHKALFAVLGGCMIFHVPYQGNPTGTVQEGGRVIRRLLARFIVVRFNEAGVMTASHIGIDEHHFYALCHGGFKTCSATPKQE
jgi:hypothetical protein